MPRAFAVIMALATLSGCDKQDAAPTEHAALAPTAAPAPRLSGEPPVAWGLCAACHSLEPGQHGIGPSLFGIYGRKAASQPGYAYSPALKAAGLTWDEPTLDRWITRTQDVVPGTKMTFYGTNDPARRRDVIEFLKTLK